MNFEAADNMPEDDHPICGGAGGVHPATVLPRPSYMPPLRLLLASLLITGGVPFLYGYHLTLISPAEPALLHFVNKSVSAHYAKQFDNQQIEAIWGVCVAMFFIGSVPGALLMQSISDHFGRKPVLVLSNAIAGVACALHGAAKFLNCIELFAFSRFIIGFWTIVGLGIGSVFLTECSPKYCRGAIGMLTGLMIQSGAVVGSVLGMSQLLGDDSKWWLIYLVGTIMQLLITSAMIVFHESPSYLMARDKEAEAEKSVQFYWGKKSQGEMNEILEEIRTDLRANSDKVGMLAVWRERKGLATRRGLWIGLVLGWCISFCGVAVLDAYLVEIFHHSMGFSLLDSSMAFLGIQFFGLVACVPSTLIVDRFGRRPLLFASFIIMIGANLCIALTMYIQTTRSLFLIILMFVALILFYAAMCGGLMSLYYFVATEMVSQSARSATQGWARLTDSVSRSVVLAIYLPVRNTIGDGPAYALLFLPVLGCAIIYLYFAFPETKNRSLMEVESELERLATKWPTFRRKRHRVGGNEEIG